MQERCGGNGIFKGIELSYFIIFLNIAMRTSLTILALALATCLSAQKEKAYHNHLHQAGIDDFRSETADFQYSEKGKFTYLISNDKENIYIDLRFVDKAVQRQVISSGVTVWISTDGKKSKDMGVRYPVRSFNRDARGGPGQQNMQRPPDGQANPGMDRQGAGPGGMGNMPDMNNASLELIGFSESGPAIIPNNEEGNFRGYVKTERSGNLIYELIMPFSKLPPISDQPDRKGVSPFTLGIAYNEIPAMGGGFGGPPSGGGMPGGGRPSGGAGGGRPSGGSSMPNQPAAAQTIVWIQDIRLAAEK